MRKMGGVSTGFSDYLVQRGLTSVRVFMVFMVFRGRHG